MVHTGKLPTTSAKEIKKDISLNNMEIRLSLFISEEHASQHYCLQLEPEGRYDFPPSVLPLYSPVLKQGLFMFARDSHE